WTSQSMPPRSTIMALLIAKPSRTLPDGRSCTFLLFRNNIVLARLFRKSGTECGDGVHRALWRRAYTPFEINGAKLPHTSAPIVSRPRTLCARENPARFAAARRCRAARNPLMPTAFPDPLSQHELDRLFPRPRALGRSRPRVASAVIRSHRTAG